MTQEEIDLLTKDLCARLPYYCHFKVRWGDEDYNILAVGFGRVTLVKPFMSMTSGSPLVEEVKPYLRPMSSMTEKEMSELRQWGCLCMTPDGCVEDVGVYGAIHSIPVIDWLNAHHFDYRGLIPMGLAIEATEGMYNI